MAETKECPQVFQLLPRGKILVWPGCSERSNVVRVEIGNEDDALLGREVLKLAEQQAELIQSWRFQSSRRSIKQILVAGIFHLGGRCCFLYASEFFLPNDRQSLLIVLRLHALPKTPAIDAPLFEDWA